MHFIGKYVSSTTNCPFEQDNESGRAETSFFTSCFYLHISFELLSPQTVLAMKQSRREFKDTSRETSRDSLKNMMKEEFACKLSPKFNSLSHNTNQKEKGRVNDNEIQLETNFAFVVNPTHVKIEIISCI